MVFSDDSDIKGSWLLAGAESKVVRLDFTLGVVELWNGEAGMGTELWELLLSACRNSGN